MVHDNDSRLTLIPRLSPSPTQVIDSTSCLPPEQARDKAVSLVRSDCASISAPWSSNIWTVDAWPPVAARTRGVHPKTQKKHAHVCKLYNVPFLSRENVRSFTAFEYFQPQSHPRYPYLSADNMEVPLSPLQTDEQVFYDKFLCDKFTLLVCTSHFANFFYDKCTCWKASMLAFEQVDLS
jgi:hypothetical protein